MVPMTERIERRGPTLLWAVAGYGAGDCRLRLVAIVLADVRLPGDGRRDRTVSTVIRNIVRQLETPDRLRGRMTGVNMVFFMGGPQLGELEAGAVANWLGATFSVVSGGRRLSARHRVGGGNHADAARLSARRGGENGRRAVTTIVIGLISDTHGLLRPRGRSHLRWRRSDSSRRRRWRARGAPGTAADRARAGRIEQRR